LIMIFYYLIIRIPFAYILSSNYILALNGIWVAILISHVVAFIITSVYSKKTFKSLKKLR
ncbi:MAG: MATE family efflux transporter, partial [Sarcina sp.]